MTSVIHAQRPGRAAPRLRQLDMEMIRDVDKDAGKPSMPEMLETVGELGPGHGSALTPGNSIGRGYEHCLTSQGYLFAKPATPPPVLSLEMKRKRLDFCPAFPPQIH